MPSTEIKMILAQLSEMRRENAHEHSALHEKLNKMAVDGTAVSRQNHEIIARQAEILDRHEKYINRQAGQVAIIGGGAAILAMIGKFLLQKVL